MFLLEKPYSYQKSIYGDYLHFSRLPLESNLLEIVIFVEAKLGHSRSMQGFYLFLDKNYAKQCIITVHTRSSPKERSHDGTIKQ